MSILRCLVLGCLLLPFIHCLGQSDVAGKKQGLGQEPGIRVADSLLARFAQIEVDSQFIDSVYVAAWKQLTHNPKGAQVLIKAGEERSLQISDSIRLARGYLFMGSVFRQYGTMEIALKYFFDCLALSERQGSKGLAASAYNNIATIKSFEGDKAGSIPYFRKSREMLIASGNAQLASVPLQNIAAVYSEIGQPDLSIQTYDTVLEELGRLENLAGMSTAKNNLGALYVKKGEYKRARKFFGESLQLKAQISDLVGMSELLVNIADYHLAVGQIDSARYVCQIALEKCQQVGAMANMLLVYRKQAEVSEKAGDWKSAAAEYKAFLELQDSVNTAKDKESKARLLAAFDIQTKEAEIKLLNKDKELQDLALERANSFKWFMAIGISILFLAVLLLLRSNRARAKANISLNAMNRQISTQKLEIERQNSDLKGQNDRLEELNREMDGILHIVAHDLKAPLNQAAGLANLVEISGDLNADQAKYLGMIAKVTDNAGRLVRDLVEISKLEGEKEQVVLRPTDLREVAQQVIEQFEGTAKAKEIAFEASLADNLPFVLSEENALRRVMENLVSNAIKFSKPGSKVEMKAWLEGEQCKISVKDHGPGFNAADKAKVFKKFARLSAQPTAGENSTGLGLAIVDALVGKLQANIELESEQGKGATFVLSLPKA